MRSARAHTTISKGLYGRETKESQIEEDADYGAVDSVRVLAGLYGERSEGQRTSGRAFRRATHDKAPLREGDKSVRVPIESTSHPRGAHHDQEHRERLAPGTDEEEFAATGLVDERERNARGQGVDGGEDGTEDEREPAAETEVLFEDRSRKVCFEDVSSDRHSWRTRANVQMTALHPPTCKHGMSVRLAKPQTMR